MLRKFRPLLLLAPLFAPAAMAQAYLTATPNPINLQGTNDGNSITRQVTIDSFINGIVGPVQVARDFTVATNQPWITFSATSGTTPRTITVTFNPRNLPGGVNLATITASSPAAASVQIPVSLNIGFIDVTRQTAPTPACFTGTFVCFYHHVSITPTSDFKTSEILLVAGPSNFNVSFQVLSGGNWLSVNRQGANINVNAQPLGLAPGATYQARITITATRYLPLVIDVDFIVEGQANLSASPATRTASLTRGIHSVPPIALLTLSSPGFSPQLKFTFNIAYPAASGWLTAQPTSDITPAALNLTADTRNLPLGNSSATITFYDSRLQQAAQVIVTITVVATTLTPTTNTLTLVFGASSGQVGISTNGPTLAYTATADKPWVGLNPASGNVSSTVQFITVTLLPTLPTGPQTANLTITAGGISIVVTINASGGAGSTSRRIAIPQVADGGNWKTTVVIISTDTVPAQFTLRFYRATGEALALPVAGRGMVNEVPGTVNAGGFQIVETEGIAPDLLAGWAEVATQNRLGGYAIFRSRSSAQDSEGVVPIPSIAGKRLLVPFDNSNGFATSVAIANAETTPCDAGMVRFSDEAGRRFLDMPFQLSSRNRKAFRLIDEYPALVNRRGVAEFSCAGVDLFMVGFRFNPDGAFTSVDPVDPAADLSGRRRIVPQVADGDGWKTTTILNNLDSVDAQVTVGFFGQNGLRLTLPVLGEGPVSEVTRRIAAGGSAVVETEGGVYPLIAGWAEIVSQQKVVGTAVFRRRLTSSFSEGAVPLPTAAGRRLLLFFDNQAGFDTAVAIANPDNPQTVVSARFLDANGTEFGSGPLTVAGRSREAFQLVNVFAATAGRRGLIELTSSSADVYVVVLRFNPRSSFTSLTPVVP